MVYLSRKMICKFLILTDIVGIAMLIIVAAVGTDLAESLILPGSGC